MADTTALSDIGLTYTRLSGADLADIAARAAAATPGPWVSLAQAEYGDPCIELAAAGERQELYLSYGTDHGVRSATLADQDFVAHARQDIPRLLAEIQRLRECLQGN